MANPADTVAKLGLHILSAFVPFSQSRNVKEKSPSLNWKVTLYTMHDGKRRDILTTDYMAGSAHAPSYKQASFGKPTVEQREQELKVAWECEHGKPALRVVYEGTRTRIIGAAGERNDIKPNALDVIYSLVSDSDVLDAGGFEDWARELGFDTDSRKAEAIYRACIDIALKLRGAIGDAGMAELREAFDGY